MTGLNFITEYLKQKPDYHLMQLSGIPTKNIQRYLNAFKIESKDTVDISNNNTQIEFLYTRYNMANIEIRSFCFLDNLKYSDNFCIFGRFDTERVACNLNTNEIVMLDENSNYIMCGCAPNENLFFDALISCAEYSKKLKENSNNTIEAPNERVDKIVKLVGDKYRDFYCVLLGCYS
ncbi:MAG: hypothetical protein H6605_03705 [Flavobacteriales bacterium]|nr:hypothetical protein [Flavobacteriales bacterium]